MGQGVGRVWRPPAPRVEHARPFFDEFWRFGPDKGTSIDFGQATKAAETAAARALSLALVISASVTRRRPALSFSVEASMSPAFSLPIPHFMLDATVDLEPISSSA